MQKKGGATTAEEDDNDDLNKEVGGEKEPVHSTYLLAFPLF